MLKFSQLISLPVINLYETKFEGVVENIFLNPDRKKVEYVIVYNEKNDIYKAIKFNNIYKVGNDSIFITNSSKITLYENIELETTKLVNPLNAFCYDLDGKLLGKLDEIYINGNTIENIEINSQMYSNSTISGLNKNLVVLSPNKTVNLKKFKQPAKRIPIPKSLNAESEPVVSIMNNNITPSRAITNYNFLVNRTILKDIKSHSGEIIASKNTLITLSTINKLKYYGKLKELMLYSK